MFSCLVKSGKRDSDPRPQPWQGCALPTELFPHTKNNKKNNVKRRRLELPRHNWHYPLKVARLPIPPPLQHLKMFFVPRTGLEPARLSTHAPETCASTNSATWAKWKPTFPVRWTLERKTGLGPATPTLARLCSTNWAISALFKIGLSAKTGKWFHRNEIPNVPTLTFLFYFSQ